MPGDTATRHTDRSADGSGGLLERDAPLTATRTVIARAKSGAGGTLFVVGEAGLGKTSILRHARKQASSMELEVVWGSGAEMEQALPFGLLSQVLHDLGIRPAGSGKPESLVDPAAPHHRVLRRLQARSGRPLLIVLDDLHWADEDSLGLFTFLARRLERLPVALIAALRPWPRPAYDQCHRLAGGGHADVVHLAPLSRGAADHLLSTRIGADPDTTTEDRAWQLCHGNPLLIEQVAAALARGERLPDSGQDAAALTGPVLLARFAGLNRPSLDYASAASVFGLAFDPHLVALAAGLDGPAADRAAEPLFRTGLAREDGDGTIRFVHQLLAQALYDDLPPPVRRRLHARYVGLLADRGMENEASEHAMRAGLTSDPEAGALLQRTGEAALAAGAVATAARHLDAAVQVWGPDAPPSLRLALSQALVASGRAVDAAAVCTVLLGDSRLAWTDRVAALRISGRSLYFTGTPDHGEARLQEASDLAAQHDPAAVVEPLLDQSLCAWLGGGPARALSLAARARDLAQHAGERLRQRAEATWGHLAYEAGDPSGLLATAEIGERLQRGAGAGLLDPTDLAWPWAPLYQFAMNENYAGRYQESQEAFGLAADALEQAGAVNALATVHIHLASVTVRRGLLDDALRHASRAEEFAELTPAIVPYARLVRAEALLWCGRLEESEASCQVAEVAGSYDWFARLWLAYVRGVRLLWEGDVVASDRFLVVEEVMDAAGIREPCNMLWGAHAVVAHLGAGRDGDARRVVAGLEAAAATLPCRWPGIAACLGRARLAARDGDVTAAEVAYTHALDLLAAADLPLQRAEALLAYGGFLRRTGRRVEARPHLAQALTLSEASGAAGLAATARTELGLVGGRPRRQQPDPTRLTDAERRVARCAAEGLSNADIGRALYLSVHTVESHLKRVYAKLGITSRRQLMTMDTDRMDA